jgi:hypothetical protein
MLKLVTTMNYIAVANSHTLQFTIASTKSSQLPSVVLACQRFPTLPIVQHLLSSMAGDSFTFSPTFITVEIYIILIMTYAKIEIHNNAMPPGLRE